MKDKVKAKNLHVVTLAPGTISLDGVHIKGVEYFRICTQRPDDSGDLIEVEVRFLARVKP